MLAGPKSLDHNVTTMNHQAQKKKNVMTICNKSTSKVICDRCLWVLENASPEVLHWIEIADFRASKETVE